MNNSRTADHPTLFPISPTVPERFRLDDETRRRGMRHVARLRAQLEARFPTPTAARSPSRSGRHAA